MANITVEDKTGGLFVYNEAKSKNIENTLVKGKPLIVAGTFTPDKKGKYKLTVTLNFDGGESVPASTQVSEAIEVTIETSLKTPLPATMALNQEQAVEFNFTNSTAFAATQVVLNEVVKANKGTLSDVKYVLTGSDNGEISKGNKGDFDNVKTIPAGAKLVITALYKAPAAAITLANGDIGFNLKYKGGSMGSRYAHEKFWPSCPQN